MATEIVMPRLSDSMEEGTIVQWFVAEGDVVAEGQPLVEVETDKASVTYEAEQPGTVVALRAAVGESVAVGAAIAELAGEGADAPAAPASAVPAAPASAVPAATAAAPRGAAPPGARVRASPLARRLAAQLGVDLATLPGSGPQGRVTRADVERGRAAARSGNGDHGGEAARPAAAPGSAKGDLSRIELTRVQHTIARRMAESRATIPDFELRCEVDMSAAVQLREQLRALIDPPPSYNDLLVKAAALALRELPAVNGAYRDAGLELHSRVNIGIAVATDGALLVPTIFDADRRSLREIAAATHTAAERVRAGTITPAELSGATFSISNLGMYGIDSFSAVINPPQAAILAVGSLRPRPVVADDGTIVARPTVVLTLACDHRVLYGADGARFLSRVRELVQSPLTLLLDDDG